MSEKKSGLMTLEQVKESITGACLRFSPWWVPAKTLTLDEREEAAEAMGAQPRYVKGQKSLIDTRHPAWARLEQFRRAVKQWWEMASMPYIIPNVRLIPRANRQAMFAKVAERAEEFQELVGKLQDAREELIEAARGNLGRAFDPTAYPSDFRTGRFKLSVMDVSIDPPSYLAATNAEEYKREMHKRLEYVQASLNLFENQMMRRLMEVAGNLINNLDGGRIMSGNFVAAQQVFDRVANLNFQGTELFRQSLSRAEKILTGVTAEDCRTDSGLRADVCAELQAFVKEFEACGKAIVDAA